LDDRLRYLILEVWEHDHLPGPETDLAYQDRCRADWIATLTVEDCLTLAEWLSDPVLPTEWGIAEHWHNTAIHGVPYYLGRAGRRLEDRRIQEAVIGLLRCPRSRQLGLECAQELRSAELFPELLRFLGDAIHRADVCIAVAAVATSAQIEDLRNLVRSKTTAPEIRSAATEAVAEWEMVRWERANVAEPDLAPDQPRD
jgi:hypothetical protein